MVLTEISLLITLYADFFTCSQFGTKVIQIKPLVKEFQRLIEDRDKGVRDESKFLVIEMLRWVGTGLRSQFTNLKQVHVSLIG